MSVAALLLWGLLSAKASVESTTHSLATVGTAEFSLNLEDCKQTELYGKRCSAVIGLRKRSGATAAGIKLEWQVPAAFTVEKHDAGAGVWLMRGGEEQGAVELRSQVVRLGASRTGLLVTQVRGFEWIHRSHQLLTEIDGKLKRVWAQADTASGFPEFWTVEVRDLQGDGIDEVLAHYWAIMDPNSSLDDPPEAWSLLLVRWNAQRKRIVAATAQQAKLPLWTVIVGSYQEVSAAKKARQKWLATCGALGQVIVLQTEALPRLKPGLIVLAKVFVDRADAQRALKKLNGCVGVRGYLKRGL